MKTSKKQKSLAAVAFSTAMIIVAAWSLTGPVVAVAAVAAGVFLACKKNDLI